MQIHPSFSRKEKYKPNIHQPTSTRGDRSVSHWDDHRSRSLRGAEDCNETDRHTDLPTAAIFGTGIGVFVCFGSLYTLQPFFLSSAQYALHGSINSL